ncbi:MAG: zinc-binding dehydrogenase [Candidatus Kapabacteria bacterium]|jgi:NADPH:quinone reductase-like Zn-dependent oxidoreductase|nr:zinc-binding dehydrogenase [Candidatus Kapabacteria bacterium]
MLALVLHEQPHGSTENTALAQTTLVQTASLHRAHSRKTYRVNLEDVPKPTLGAGQVLVRMSAAALNHRDEWIRKGQYARIRPGVILGSDGCGIVEEVASKADEHLLGQEVVLNPSIGWGANPRVQDREYTILGLPVNGTFAEYCAVSAQNCFPKPTHLRAVEAAALPLAGLTAYRAVRTHAEVSEGVRVLVTGIGGGVAQFAAQFAVALGASVYATSGDDTKLTSAIERIGLAGGANYHNPEWHKTLSESAGEFDCVIDSAVGNSLDALLALLGMGGRYVFYGATAGRPSSVNVQMIFWKQLRLQGSTMGNDAEFGEMLRFVEDHRIVPIVDSVRPFTEIGTAFEAMSEGRQFGKLVVTFAHHT